VKAADCGAVREPLLRQRRGLRPPVGWPLSLLALVVVGAAPFPAVAVGGHHFGDHNGHVVGGALDVDRVLGQGFAHAVQVALLVADCAAAAAAAEKAMGAANKSDTHTRRHGDVIKTK
jgi:hypothetical protein